jgi:hypothetical protein
MIPQEKTGAAVFPGRRGKHHCHSGWYLVKVGKPVDLQHLPVFVPVLRFDQRVVLPDFPADFDPVTVG